MMARDETSTQEEQRDTFRRHSPAILSGKDIFHYGLSSRSPSAAHNVSLSSWDILSAITRTHLFLTVILSPPQTNRESFPVSHPLRIGRKKASLWPSARSIWTLWETCSTANPTLAPCDDTYTHSLLEIRSDGKREKIGTAWRGERLRMSGVIAHCLWTISARRGREINDAHWRRTWDACFRE